MSARARLSRADVLDSAKKLVTQDRTKTHGDIDDLFSMIARSWSAKLGITVTPEQVSLLLADLKTCRAWRNPLHGDNWKDGAGYFALGAELAGALDD